MPGAFWPPGNGRQGRGAEKLAKLVSLVMGGMRSLLNKGEKGGSDTAPPPEPPAVGDLLRPCLWWHWLAYLICLVILIWIGAHARTICSFEGDDLNVALGVKMAVQGMAPLEASYRFATAAGLYYPLYFMASLGLDPLSAYYIWAQVCAYLFVLVFSLFAARLLRIHFSLCLLALLSLQEVIASFLYANDMIVGMLLVSCGLAVQVFRPRFWFPLTALCAALAIWVRIDLAQAVLLNLILVHFPDRAVPVRQWKALLTDLALAASIVLIWLGLMRAGGVDLDRAFWLAARHLPFYLSNPAGNSFVTMESLRSILGPWLVPACLGVLWMAWDRRLIPCLLVASFCLAGLLAVFPLATTPKYLLPHLALASLGAAYSLGRLLSGRLIARLLGAGLAGVCLLFPLMGNFTLNRMEVKPLSIQKGFLASYTGNRLLNIGSGRVLTTHDGVRLTGGYLFLPPLADMIKHSYRQVWEQVDRRLDQPGTQVCFGNAKDWMAHAMVVYKVSGRGFSLLDDGVWSAPHGGKTVVLKELAGLRGGDASCNPDNTLYLDFTPRLPCTESAPKPAQPSGTRSMPGPAVFRLLLGPDGPQAAPSAGGRTGPDSDPSARPEEPLKKP